VQQQSPNRFNHKGHEGKAESDVFEKSMVLSAHLLFNTVAALENRSISFFQQRSFRARSGVARRVVGLATQSPLEYCRCAPKPLAIVVQQRSFCACSGVTRRVVGLATQI